MTTEPKHLGVVGAGTMGAGIAQVAAVAGLTVVLYDITPEVVERGLSRIRASLARAVERGRLTAAGQAEALGRITATAELGDVASVDAVIEAAPEDLALKRRVFADLERVCGPEVLLSSNTSSLSLTQLAQGLAHPERVVGMHFFNPVPAQALVEIIGGVATDETRIAAATALARRLGKTPVQALDAPGFIVNRVARPFTGEALRILGEGIAAVPEIDRIVRAAGFRMGPFELIDLVGNDINFAVHKVMYEETFGEPRYRPHRLQAQMVAAGHLGQKTGRGFYRYENGRPLAEETPDPFADVTAPNRPANVLVAGQGPVADDLALTLQAMGQTVSTYSTEESPSLAQAGIPRARRLRDVLLTTTVAIEATLGPRDLKRAYWFELDESLPPQIPILSVALGHGTTELGSWSNRPERVIGFGYTGSFADTPIVELARGLRTSDAPLRRAIAFLRGIGKPLAVVGDPPGQVLMRLLSCLVNEAAFALDEGIAAPDDIDTAMRLGLNYPLGPIAWSERLGLDRIVTTLDGLQAYYGEDRYRVAPRLRRALLAGQARLS